MFWQTIEQNLTLKEKFARWMVSDSPTYYWNHMHLHVISTSISILVWVREREKVDGNSKWNKKDAFYPLKREAYINDVDDSVTRIGEILPLWQNLKVILNRFIYYLSRFWTYFGKILCHWTNNLAICSHWVTRRLLESNPFAQAEKFIRNKEEEKKIWFGRFGISYLWSKFPKEVGVCWLVRSGQCDQKLK